MGEDGDVAGATDPMARLERIPDPGDRPAPVIHPEVEPFWAGLSDGRLLVQRCTTCGTWRYPFAPVCHRCLSFDHTWEPISPVGRVAAAVTVRRATGEAVWSSRVPYASGIVDVEHGLRLPGRILCRCGEGLARNTRVRAVILESPDHPPVLAFAHTCVRG